MAWAEGTPVMRFVPMAGAESEVPLNTLRKVVFTPDSVVLIAAEDDARTPMYKYDYQAIVFAENSAQGMETIHGEEVEPNGEKFVRDGRLYIRRDEQVYDILGNKIK